MVTQSKIYLRENLSTSELIEQDVNASKWILVLYSDCVQGSIIHT
jgi:hypothetical protein